MTGLKEGERLKYQRDGRLFSVTKITRDFVVLRALDDSTQILTGTSSLDFLFEKPPRPIPGRADPSESRPTRHFRE